MGTYRVDEDVLATALAWATKRDETVTDVLVQALHVYIQACETASAPPAAESPVYTALEGLERYEEPSGESLCKHPSTSVTDLNVCRDCNTELD